MSSLLFCFVTVLSALCATEPAKVEVTSDLTKIPQNREEYYPIRTQLRNELISKCGPLPAFSATPVEPEIQKTPDAKNLRLAAILVHPEGRDAAMKTELAGKLERAGYDLVFPYCQPNPAGSHQLRLALNAIVKMQGYDHSQILLVAWKQSCWGAVLAASLDPRIEATILVDAPAGIDKYVSIVVPRRLLIAGPSVNDNPKSFSWTSCIYSTWLNGQNFNVVPNTNPDDILKWITDTKLQPYPVVKIYPAIPKDFDKEFPLPEYHCGQVNCSEIKIDGDISDPAWEKAQWTINLVGLVRGEKYDYRARAKMLWDQEYFYIAIDMEDPDIWSEIVTPDGLVAMHDDMEVFMDPDGDGRNYIDFEWNAYGTIYDALVDNKGGESFLDWNLHGVKLAIKLDGTINKHDDIDKGWTTEIAMPWRTLSDAAGKNACPPKPGDMWRVDFFRAILPRLNKTGQPVYDFRVKEFGAGWAVKSMWTNYIPERYGKVIFK